MISDTIVAPATPYGIGGIAVVRLSGPQSLLIVHKLLDNNGLQLTLKPRYATLVNLQDENGIAIDESIVTFFEAPNSYSGEDLIEISCHGSPVVMDKVISTCCHFGARLAGPGEFTKRAFLNGKMDLVQAEAVASLIHSQSEESSHLNLRLLHGELSKKLNNFRQKLIDAVSMVEFELDISEDELQPDLDNQVSAIVTEQVQQIQDLLRSYKQAHMLNRGALIVIVGPPNVGKSTLLNTLSEDDRAITSHLPGTTRDAIDVPLLLDGVPINLVDTAGIRQASEEIEREGVSRTFNYIKKADLIILVHNPGLVETLHTDYPINIPIIEIMNKVDLLTKTALESIQRSHSKHLFLSAKTGYNIPLLKQQIKTSLGISSSLSDNITITTSRQDRALKHCFDKLNAATELLNNPRCAYELVSIELREALDAIGVILGKTTPDDILNNIFNQFCVGK
ncbi:MAG: tRNA uridine-5-carboxymethylaminomethyl(34) synthesis GTPase MnmE [Candidatus Marinimicrobia bacterium]|nr:tRNA uridine-5-carboxymethylaminomethyl(34) synthesis GTPase MnmE [Candidatus Neomarinimicrobiota bacterium]